MKQSTAKHCNFNRTTRFSYEWSYSLRNDMSPANFYNISSKWFWIEEESQANSWKQICRLRFACMHMWFFWAAVPAVYQNNQEIYLQTTIYVHTRRAQRHMFWNAMLVCISYISMHTAKKRWSLCILCDRISWSISICSIHFEAAHIKNLTQIA